MNWRGSMRSWTVNLLAGLLAAAGAVFGQQPPAPKAPGPVEAHGIRFPEYNPDGTLKSLILGERAVVEENAVTIHNLRVELHEEGRLATTFWAESCRYDKEAGSLVSETAVRLVRTGLIMTGEGLEWKKGESQVVIKRNVRVSTVGGTEWFKVEKRR